ncbi:MAG TPA: ABC transporter permease [Microbacteriaceae bacterium]|nr:ABC transporter permease [Microbacteriaceae bacterium]
MTYIRELLGARELLSNLVMRDVRGQYKRTIFGRLWALVNPLVAMLVYTFVFSFVFRIQPAPGNPSGLNAFPLWLLCGLLPWTFFSAAVNSGLGSILANYGLVTKVYFPRLVLPLSAVLTRGYNWAWEMLVLAVALIAFGSFLWPWIPVALALMVLLMLFVVGVSLALCIANVHFRDTQYLISVVMQIWLYLTPVVYPLSLVKDQSDRVGGLFGTNITVLDMYSVNPMMHFIEAFRAVLYDNRFPNSADITACLIWTIAALGVGFWIFRASEKGLAEAL